MRRVKIPIDTATTIFPEMNDLGNMPRKKKKKMKKEFSKLFVKKLTEWIENGKREI
jgi:hypothetical protein